MVDEAQLLDEVSRQELWANNQQIAQWVRHSGTGEERAAFRYVQQQLEAYGLQTRLLEHPALISYPLEAALSQIDESGNVAESWDCLGAAFSASVDQLEGELLDLGYGSAEEFAAQDVQGKIVLLNGLSTPTAVYAAEQAGAIGQIFINDDHLHYMITSTIWGTPTPESASRQPTTPAVSVIERDGLTLRARIKAGKVRVRLSTSVFKAWQQTPLLVAELAGTQSDDFVLFSGHLDSWEVGAMDNGSANATMLEVARILAQRRDQLFRGLRLCFWSGHSHGRYSGSTWYADQHWEELHDHCVAHVNVDSTGARGATHYAGPVANLELGPFGATLIAQHTGQEAPARRMSRAGDMSFNGIGVPALFMTLSHIPFDEGNVNYVTEAAGKLLGATLPWWWHTSEDTLDKVDLEVLALDTRIYVSALWQLCHNPLLPMDFRLVVADIQQTLGQLHETAGTHLDLSVARERAERLAHLVSELAQRSTATAADDEASAMATVTSLNLQMKKLSRILIPITYTAAGQFEHDPAWPIPHLPLLHAMPQLAQLAPEQDAYRFLYTKLVRNRNAVNFALRQAIEVLSA